MPLYQVLALRYWLLRKNYKYDKLCYTLVRKKKLTKINIPQHELKLLILPHKAVEEIPKISFKKYDTHSIIKMTIRYGNKGIH